ncbi:hypothetical protein B9Z19DRAFT_1168212 [Tuber borchii]|uniref:Uncharacterized protein n=1 Tax=Tuber borchii TaxID=42251 RepID=A0A2T7A094_TUBBO|nr:hypothetical protein B9Z19DRAFT_1168212 [Tuber borchii]
MNPDTSNTVAPIENSGTPAASSEEGIAYQELFTEAATETIGALEAGLYGLLTGSISMVWDAIVKLSEVVKKEEEGKEEKEEKEKEKEKVMKAMGKMRVAMEMEMKRKMGIKEREERDDGGVATTAVTTTGPTGTQIPAPQLADHQSPGNPNTAKSVTPSSIMRRKITIADKVTKAPHARIAREVSQGSHRRSKRIIESTQNPGQGKLPVAATAQEDGSAVAAPVEKVIVDGMNGEIVPGAEAEVVMEKGKEVTIEGRSQVLKPRAGGGVKKKGIVASLSRRIRKHSNSGGMGKETENQSITPPTTTDKATEARRTMALHQVPHGPRRQSVRIIEAMQKSAGKEGGSAAAGQVKQEETDKAESKREIAIAVVINIKSPILKPKGGAGVQKRVDRGGKGRRVKRESV